MAKSDTPRPEEDVLCRIALGYPQAREDHPWGHRAIKVNGKTFVFLSTNDGVVSCSTKLPQSRREMLALPFATPTEYGLGKSGWVTGRFGPDELVPIDLLGRWIEESYRAIAPKKLISVLDQADPPAAARKRARAPAARRRRAR
jgi:predicted DNA-binding protein (MmcQ/YjbR family)